MGLHSLSGRNNAQENDTVKDGDVGMTENIVLVWFREKGVGVSRKWRVLPWLRRYEIMVAGNCYLCVVIHKSKEKRG